MRHVSLDLGRNNMIERIVELQNKAAEKASYYLKIGFTILANEFTEFANILAEIKEYLTQEEKGDSQNEEISKD